LGVLPAVNSCTAARRQQDARPAPDPDALLRDRVVASVQALLSSYQATVERYPRLARRIAPLAAEHEAHLTALGAPAPSGSPGPASPSVARSTATPAPAVPPEPGRALRALAGAESRAAADRVRDVVAAAGVDLARLLAAIGACEAAHAALLREEA